jgi:hypothetical protein
MKIKQCLFLSALILIYSFSFAYVIDSEFCNSVVSADSVYYKWRTAGCNAIIDSVFSINVVSIPDSMTYQSNGIHVPIPNAQPGEGFDNSTSFNLLINWLKGRPWLQGFHAEIYIPPGVYNFSDQIELFSNISLKGAGSHQTELRFLIRADSTSTSMSTSDCRKDAILVNGTGTLPAQRIRKVGIEDLKIVRIRDGLSPAEVKEKVGDYSTFNGSGYQGYWGNNIAIRRATNCWVKGVESENTFRNHVTLEFSDHITISGVYFHYANNYGGGGYGYGVGLWDSSNNNVENSIFKHLRHGVTISDKSWYNVIAYNYFRDQYSVAELPISTIILPFPDEIEQQWSDIAIHGEATNTYYYEQGQHANIDSLRPPTYNLIEGNNLEYLCVDATHMYNGGLNTFLRNRVINQIHVMGYDGFPAGFTESLIACNVITEAVSTLIGIIAGAGTGGYIGGGAGGIAGAVVGGALGWDIGFYISYSLSHVALQFVCKDCASFRMADQFTFLIPGTDNDTHKFQNQPRQLFVNNYARDYHWWRNQILDFPVRMHSEIGQYQANTYQRYYNWWGTKKGKTINGNATAYSDKSYYQSNQDVAPSFWPSVEPWPYQYTDNDNPAKNRYLPGGKNTIGEGKNGYVSVTPIDIDCTYTDDLEIQAGGLLVVSPGITVKFAPGKGLIAKGTVRIGTEDGLPVVFTCSDSTQTWDGIRLVKDYASTSLPSLEMNNCEIKLADSRALYLKDYTSATLVGCKIVNNTGDGGIYSENGVLHIENSVIRDNSLSTFSDQYGAGLFLKSTDAEIVNTNFDVNQTERLGGGALHIAADTDTTRAVSLYNWYFTGNSGSNWAFQGGGVHVDDFEGAVSLYNCSFNEQDMPIQSNLAEDVLLTNCLFWNSDPGEHTLASNNFNSQTSFDKQIVYLSCR